MGLSPRQLVGYWREVHGSLSGDQVVGTGLDDPTPAEAALGVAESDPLKLRAGARLVLA